MTDERVIRKAKPVRTDLWHRLKNSLLLFLPLALLANAVLFAFCYQEIESRRHQIQAQVISRTDAQKANIVRHFRQIVADLLFFARCSQLMNMLEDSELYMARFAQDLSLFSGASRIYDQIRFLDTGGMEVVRINLLGRTPVIVAQDELQSKQNRYYFKDTISLAEGEIFVSPFDLNIERGEIERPLKPMIRFGTPVFDNQENRRGIVLFNYLGADLIEDFKEVAADAPGDFMLLNSEGYWLIGLHAADEWGFMYEDRKERNMADRFESAWRRISASQSGQFYEREGLFTFTTVYPLIEGWRSSSGSGEAFVPSATMLQAHERVWKIVAHLPRAEIRQVTQRSLVKYGTMSVVVTILLAVASWLMMQARLQKNIAKQELQRAYEIIKRQKDRMEEELNVGRDIQMSMIPLTFPALPCYPQISVNASLTPAREVGGDFYDFYFLNDELFCFCVGDVSGKGVPAALFMAVTRTLLRAKASYHISPSSIIARVNDDIAKQNEASMFVTLFFAILNIHTGELLYTNAGHNPAYVLRDGGPPERLDSRHGPVVGAKDSIPYAESQVELAQGDVVFVYTDGVTEAMNHEQQLYSEERLERLLASKQFDSTRNLIQNVVRNVQRFEDGADHADDITTLALQYLGDSDSGSPCCLDITIDNELPQIDEVNRQFNQFAADNGLPVDIRSTINIVFDELLNNVITYAFAESEHHQIQVSIRLHDDRLIAEISDDGKPFDPFATPEPDTDEALDARLPGGLGIHLVRNVMNKVAYRRSADRNIVTVIKHLPAASQH